MNKTPISTKQKSNSSGCLIVFGIPFASVGLFLLWITTVSPLLQQMGSQNWQAVPCNILESDIKEHRDSDGDISFSNEISYRYTFGESEHFGDRVDFGSNSTDRDHCKEIQKQYPSGAASECFVDPDEPSSSVLQKDARFSILSLIASCVFAFAGIGISLFGIFGLLKARSAKSDRTSRGNSSHGFNTQITKGPASNEGAAMADAADLADRESNIPKRMKPDTSTLGRLIGSILICLFWNGIVSFFVYQLFTQLFTPAFSWFLALILVPFVVIGISLLFGTVVCMLAMFNPKIELAMSSGTVPLGGKVDMAWELIGRSANIRGLTVEVIGTESATYTQGTDTHTATEDFYTEKILNSNNPEEFLFGNATLTIPADTMHTFEADQNSVMWTIEIHAEIPWWPDIKETFSFRVAPTPIK